MDIENSVMLPLTRTPEDLSSNELRVVKRNEEIDKSYKQRLVEEKLDIELYEKASEETMQAAIGLLELANIIKQLEHMIEKEKEGFPLGFNQIQNGKERERQIQNIAKQFILILKNNSTIEGVEAASKFIDIVCLIWDLEKIIKDRNPNSLGFQATEQKTDRVCEMAADLSISLRAQLPYLLHCLKNPKTIKAA